MDGMKYIYREQTGREEVYDLAADPGERRPLEGPPDDFLARARHVLQTHLDSSQQRVVDESPDGTLQEELRDRMKSLGYIQ